MNLLTELLGLDAIEYKKQYVEMQVGRRYEITEAFTRTGKKRRVNDPVITTGTVIAETDHMYVLQHENYKSTYRKCDPEVIYREI